MMQAEGNNDNYDGAQSFNDEHSFERKPFLPQHAEALRSRRRHDAASYAFSNDESEGRKRDNWGVYNPDTIPASGT
eukprot:CAMPEP_0172559366 /NCGR_PEP_ID=MMETSP1067-20121228/83689_1 /TAXON_ID=265564 ORGANISM="Thalassiosira punctigera, Strain Tpunct2005C2" /NCGR_SAMPLE_ID=MMETSP1067 /ASSEMBLY_ACC=CAM_ASM_000444 /LENGTH=75 /DNA_ID=CAMNT_0013348941 /DNA_START=10 /DNA_END=234 /DNA_ORIENTATION=-